MTLKLCVWVLVLFIGIYMSSPWPSGRPAYPYSLTAKFMYFPWKFHWKNSRVMRFLGLAFVIWTYPAYKIHKAVHSPGNVAQWDEIRRKRDHTHFDPPNKAH